MKKIIDIPDDIKPILEHMVIDENAKDLKNFIQDKLRELAEAHNPSVKKKKKIDEDY
jgi:hypothetical protein